MNTMISMPAVKLLTRTMLLPRTDLNQAVMNVLGWLSTNTAAILKSAIQPAIESFPYQFLLLSTIILNDKHCEITFSVSLQHVIQYGSATR